LRRLEAQGALESYWGEESQGGRRKYYRGTEAGKVLYGKNYDAWQTVKNLIDQLIERRREA